MENQTLKATALLAEIAHERRLILLGGMAVILYGMSRTTLDCDVWLDPNPSSAEWSTAIEQIIQRHPQLRPCRIGPVPGTWDLIDNAAIRPVADSDRLVRLIGADRPIDVFFIPNELEASDFDAVWQRGRLIEEAGGLKLMEEVDLLVTKQLTGRPHDEADMRFLERRIELSYSERLKTCDPVEGEKLLARFATPALAAVAAAHESSPEMRALGLTILREMSDEGDLIAVDILQDVVAKRVSQEM